MISINPQADGYESQCTQAEFFWKAIICCMSTRTEYSLPVAEMLIDYSQTKGISMQIPKLQISKLQLHNSVNSAVKPK